MEIADNDGGSNNPAPKAKKSRPVLIAATALFLTFGGAFIAQSSQDSPTSVEQSIVPQASQFATSVPQASQSATSVAPAISPIGPSPTNPPAIATPPSMKGGDDDDDDFEEDGHRNRRDREDGDRDEDDDDHDDDDEFEDH